MKFITIPALLLHVSFAYGQIQNSQSSGSTYDQLYRSGVEAYGGERWFECASLMALALEDRKSYREGVARCRSQCRAAGSIGSLSPTDVESVEFYLGVGASHSQCIEECKRTKFAGRPERAEDTVVEDAFRRLMPYDYLQMCAYKVNRFLTVLN